MKTKVSDDDSKNIRQQNVIQLINNQVAICNWDMRFQLLAV